jgi:hypothetical protein
LRLKNFSDTPDATIHRMIDFVDPGLAKDVRVVVRNSQVNSHGFSRAKTKEIVVYMPKHQTYPYYLDMSHSFKWIKSEECNDTDIALKEQQFNNRPYKLIKYRRKTGYLPSLLLTKEEDMIMILAHELRHQWQRRRPPKTQWAWGCQGNKTKFAVERDASVYELKKIREWRRIHNPQEMYPEFPW